MGVLTDAAAFFSFAGAEEKRLNQLRDEFVQRFPVSKLPSLKLEEYALGIEPKENSFCWWLEFNTSDIARIGGATALKHVIYFSREKQEFVFNRRYSTKGQAFDGVRAGLMRLVELAGAG